MRAARPRRAGRRPPIHVMIRPETAGPTSMTGNIMRPVNFGMLWPWRSRGRTRSNAPVQEMAKVSRKQASAGRRRKTVVDLLAPICGAVVMGLALETRGIRVYAGEWVGVPRSAR